MNIWINIPLRINDWFAADNWSFVCTWIALFFHVLFLYPLSSSNKPLSQESTGPYTFSEYCHKLYSDHWLAANEACYESLLSKLLKCRVWLWKLENVNCLCKFKTAWLSVLICILQHLNNHKQRSNQLFSAWWPLNLGILSL